MILWIYEYDIYVQIEKESMIKNSSLINRIQEVYLTRFLTHFEYIQSKTEKEYH